MSEQQPTPTTPAEPAQPAQEAPQGGSPTPGTQMAEPTHPSPFKAFATEKELKSYVADEVTRTAAKLKSGAVRQLAKEFGFEDADEMREWLAAQRQGQSQTHPAQPAQPAQQGPSAADLLNMKLQVAAAKNLPVALVARLQGSTQAELEADADQLLGLVQGGQAQPSAPQPGIRPAPQGGQPVTFSRSTQLSDPAFVRANKEAIQRASAEGRIVP